MTQASYRISEKTSRPGSFERPFRKRQLHRKGRAIHCAAQPPHKLNRCRRGASRSQQIVADDDAFARANGVFVNLQRIGAVLELVGNFGRLGRQFLRFSHGNESGAKPIRQCGGEDETTRLHADDNVNLAIGVVVAEFIHKFSEAALILEQRRQIVEKNSWLGIVRDFTNQLLEIIHSGVLGSELLIVIHGKVGTEIGENFRLRFGHDVHGRKTRAALQFASELPQLRYGADGIDFHAPIRQIPGVPCDSELFRRVHGKISIADALHLARNKKPLRISLPLHSRQPQNAILSEEI